MLDRIQVSLRTRSPWVCQASIALVIASFSLPFPCVRCCCPGLPLLNPIMLCLPRWSWTLYLPRRSPPVLRPHQSRSLYPPHLHRPLRPHRGRVVRPPPRSTTAHRPRAVRLPHCRTTVRRATAMRLPQRSATPPRQPPRRSGSPHRNGARRMSMPVFCLLEGYVPLLKPKKQVLSNRASKGSIASIHGRLENNNIHPNVP